MSTTAANSIPGQMHLNRDLAVLVLVVVGASLPFLGQPFHMDDNFYFDMARNVPSHPLFPYDAPYDFSGYHVPDTASHSHPPLPAYLLAAVRSFAGEEEGREWIYHGVFLLFPLLAAVSMYWISAFYVARPLWPALALAVSPVAQVMGHTLMADVPALSLWLASIACFMWGTDSNRKGLVAASALFQTAAMFMAYQSVSLTLLLAYYHIRKRGRSSGWIALMAPPAALGAWLWLTSRHFGRFILGGTLWYIQLRSAEFWPVMGTKAVAFLQYQGWLVVFPFFLLYVFARGLQGRLFFLYVLASLYVVQAAAPGYRLVDKAIFVAGLATGAAVVCRMILLLRDAFLRREGTEAGRGGLPAQFLALWYFGVSAYCLLVLPEGSARYILPLAPVVLLCFFHSLEVTEVAEYRTERGRLLNSAMVASGALVLSLAWGLFLAQADFEFARVYPRAASAFTRLSSGLDSYLTGEWGFRYYFTRVGARPLPADESTVLGGSLLIRPRLAMPYEIPHDLSSMTMTFSSLSFGVRTPFRTLDTETPAGFYSTGWGLIPFSFSGRNLETLEIQQVNFMVERLPWAAVECPKEDRPWPGYVFHPARALAILCAPGTRIVYPWKIHAPLTLTVGIGTVEGAAPAAGGGSCEFVIEFRDGPGPAVASVSRTLQPGTAPKDREWQEVSVSLPAGVTGKETLEFRYEAHGDSVVTGAWVQALLTPR